MDYILPLQQLIEQFGQLKGVGKKTAQRYAFNILDMTDEEAILFAQTILKAKKDIHPCDICGNLTDKDICDICSDDGRDKETICVVSETTDVMSIEQTREFNGVYHVLNGVISPSKGISPDKLRIKELIDRIEKENIKELIIATNTGIDGETTALYLAKMVNKYNIKVTRPASGIPVGADLEYADRVTLAHAFNGRTEIK